METSEYIVNKLKTLVQFTQPFTTRYILGTFQMLLCHLPNMCSQDNISNISRVVPEMFLMCPNSCMVITMKNFGIMLNTFRMLSK